MLFSHSVEWVSRDISPQEKENTPCSEPLALVSVKNGSVYLLLVYIKFWTIDKGVVLYV
jgi:hypothetical protein